MVENWEKSKLSISWISRHNLGLFSTSRWKPQLRLHLPESSFDWDLSLLADSIPDWLIKECHLAIQQIALPWRKRCHYSLVSTGSKKKKTCFISPFGDIKKLLLRISWIVMFHNFHIRFIPRNERTWIWFHYSIQAKKHHTYRYFWTQEIPLNLQKASERWLRPNLTSML